MVSEEDVSCGLLDRIIILACMESFAMVSLCKLKKGGIENVDDTMVISRI